MGTPRFSPAKDGPSLTGGRLADALFTSTQRRVLAVLFPSPDLAFTLTDIIRSARAGRGAVQREVRRLHEAGLITMSVVHGSKLYQANRACPIFLEVAAIVRKTSGIAEAVADRLAALRDPILFAALFGSIAKGTDTSSSDVDVLIVSDTLSLEDTFAALAPVEVEIGRKVSPLIYSVAEFERRIADSHGFLKSVLNGPYVALVGSVDDALAAG